jgi:nucleoside-diphosphate-sugar epimerase
MKCVVTGGAGFIGSNLVEALLAAGHKVTVIDNFATGSRENLAAVESDITLREGDIRNEALLLDEFEGVEVVFHEAALPSVARSVEKPVESHDVNATGTLNVLRAARERGVRRVVYASSSSAYGDTIELPKVETMTPAPLSPYAVAKLTGEYYCRIFPQLYGLETVALRYFNVFGPRQDPTSQYAAAVAIFINRILSGETVRIDGDGGQTRDFTYVANVVEANILAATAEKASGECFNIGVGLAHSINDLFEMICETAGFEGKSQNAPPRPGDVRDSLADISRARALLGYEPKYDLADGLRETIAYFLEGRS